MRSKAIKNCKLCNNIFHPHYGKDKPRDFCSVKCYLSYRWRGHQSKISCKKCGKQFIAYVSEQRQYCSRKCAFDDYKNIHKYRQNRLSRICEYCHKEFSRQASYFKVSTGRFCSHVCSAKWWAEYGLHGEKHSRWKGGRYPVYQQAYSDGWGIAKRQALEKAKGRCENCGTDKRKLDVHHIKALRVCQSAKEANHSLNLMAICRPCHRKLELFSK